MARTEIKTDYSAERFLPPHVESWKPDPLKLKPHNFVTPCANPSKFNSLRNLNRGTSFANFVEIAQVIRPFGQISVKFSVLSSYILIVAPMGVKFGTSVHSRVPYFTPSMQRVTPAGQEPQNYPLINLYTGALRNAAGKNSTFLAATAAGEI